MPDSFGPIYEVTHFVDREIIEDFDAWLGQHIEEMLSIQGIWRAVTFSANDGEVGRPARVSHYHFDSDADLDSYLKGPAVHMRQSAVDRFGGRFEAHRRVLHENQVVDGSLYPTEACLNCGTVLSGQYCGECGQRAMSRLISIWQLLREAFGDLLELDSRLWRTLLPLAARPGKLTRDYLEGRRARFMPPFRTYLVLSIVFFLVAFFDPREEFGILLEPEAAPPVASEEPDADQGLATTVLVPEQGPVSVDEERKTTGDAERFNLRVNGNRAAPEDCDDFGAEDLPPWLAVRLAPERLKIMCERLVADDGRAWVSKLLDNVPAALIALLPLMALVLKALYPLSKRYYVEHVLFVVHYHAFIFLILSLQIMFSRLVTLLGMPDGVSLATTVAVSLYIPIYLFRAMRRVYEQRWLITAAKYLVLIAAYFVGLMAILGATALIAAFTI